MLMLVLLDVILDDDVLVVEVLPVKNRRMAFPRSFFPPPPSGPTFVREVYRGPYGNPALKRVDPFR